MNQKNILATSAAPPSLLTQVGMAGTAAVITVSVQDLIPSGNRSHFRQMRCDHQRLTGSFFNLYR